MFGQCLFGLDRYVVVVVSVVGQGIGMFSGEGVCNSATYR